MISTHKFESWHVDEMQNIRKEFKFISEYKDNTKKLEGVDGCPVYTLAKDGVPIGVIGGTFMYPHVMRVFSLLSDDIKKWPKSFHKEVKRIMDLYFEECDLNRMEMDVRSDFKDAQRWAEGLGFVKECLMKKYGYDGSDYYLYARYRT